MDFTIRAYSNLLKSLRNTGFLFVSFEEYMKGDYPEKFAILRHDVDLLPQNSLRFARIQAEMGIRGSYYFRAVPESWDEKIIKEISDLGHEVGYHYENMDVMSSKFKVEGSKLVPGTRDYDQLLDLAYEDFKVNLEKLRKLVPVSTICMHGSPKSKFDNKAIWDKYDYKSLGLIGEPYYDVDFDNIFYITDTGRRWDGWKVSVRDKVPQQDEWIKRGLIFHSTHEIINDLKQPEATRRLPNQIMFTFHPQRWHSSFISWAKELVLQNAKNMVKRYFFVR